QPLLLPGRPEYPAVVYGQASDINAGTCTVSVGLADDLTFSVQTIQEEDPKNACLIAQKVASIALEAMLAAGDWRDSVSEVLGYGRESCTRLAGPCGVEGAAAPTGRWPNARAELLRVASGASTAALRAVPRATSRFRAMASTLRTK